VRAVSAPVCNGYRLNHRPGAVNTETQRLAADPDREKPAH
jgi:hypothetical protein